MNCQVFGSIVGWAAGPMEIDVVDIRWLNMGLRQRSLHRKRGAQPLRMWCRHVMGVATLATTEELHEAFFTDGFDQEKFLAGAHRMLDGVKAFWDGLDADRQAGKAA